MTRRRLRLHQVTVGIGVAADEETALSREVAKRLSLPEADLSDLQVCKRSIDTRKAPRFVFSVDVSVPMRGRYAGTLPRGIQDAPKATPPPPITVDRDATKRPIVVVGAGPAGLFAAWTLAQAGFRPTLIERGKPVETRARDVSRLMHHGELQTSSNLCFGEGGAGTWSDGKLTTRLNASDVRTVLETLAAMGGPKRILTDGKPHLGTDKLVEILKQFRRELTQAGATFVFEAEAREIRRGGSGGVTGVALADGTNLDAAAIVLAVGHSSRRMYRHLVELGAGLTPKPFAVGFRVEHPQETIDELQYGRWAGHDALPAADYRLTSQTRQSGRGVYSFCMCPGGQVVPTPTEHEGVVVNGMSHAARSGPWANSALVVTVETSDFGAEGPLAGVEFQRRAEYRAGALGGGLFAAPAQRVTDFLAKKRSTELPRTSYTPGVTPAELHDCYPEFVGRALEEALHGWARRMPGFVSDEAILLGVETRTSAPVRVPRDNDTLCCPALPGLFPCGEGSGYGGGIVSAAVDGIRVARAAAAWVADKRHP